MNVTTAKSTSPLSLSLLCVFFALPVFTALAADIEWSGAAGDGKWETDGNWSGNVKPTENDFAKFPSGSDDIIVTISNTERVFSVKTGSSRTGKVTLTGDGLLEIASKRLSLYESGPGPIVYDVNVTNVYTGDDTSMYGINTYLRDLYVSDASGGPALYIREGAAMNLAGNARALTQYFNMHTYMNQSLCLSDNSSFTILKDITLNSDDALSVSDNASLDVRYIYANPDAHISFTGGSITTAGIVSNATLLAANKGTILKSTYRNTGTFVPFSDTVDTWTLHGGTIRDVNGDQNCLSMPYTNVTKTINGTGVLQIGRLFDPSQTSNMTVLVDGPSLFLKSYSKYDYRKYGMKLHVANGTTFGLWGADVNICNWNVVIDNSATFDTTDYEDKSTGRQVKFGGLEGSTGTLTVKGSGSAEFDSGGNTGGSWSYTIPDLSLQFEDSVSATFESEVAPYSMGDLILKDNASLATAYYMGNKGSSPVGTVKSLTMSDATSLDVGRFLLVSGDATLSGSAKAFVRHTNSGDAEPTFSCANLSLSDDASLVVTGQIAAATLSMSGNAHLAFTAGTGFTAGAAFEGNGWTMEITIPDNYDAGIHPIVRGMKFEDDFTNHVTMVGATEGWSIKMLDGIPALYKDAPATGLEWIGDSEDHNYYWSDSANWNNGVLPTAGDKVAFGGADGLKPFDNDYLTTVSGLVFRASAGPFVVTGSVERLSLTADSPSRGDATPDTAAIVSYSDFDQTIALPLDFGAKSKYVLAAGGGSLAFPAGFTATGYWDYFIIGGDVRVGGECSVNILSFNNKHCGGVNPRLTLLPGCNFMVGHQYFRSFSEEEKYAGSIVIEEGAVMTVQNGDCCFYHPAKESVVDGTLIVKGSSGSENGRLVATQNEQYYVGKGTIFADSARAGRNSEVTNHYINIGGTLKLYMNGDWMTATYRTDGAKVMQDPNYPTRFRMTDGTTLGATADWTYGPASDAYDVIASTLTPADRKSIMVGTVTVDTQNPTNDAAHTITFVDPIDASAANLVKVGAGTLVFNETDGYPSQISNLTVNAGVVQFTGEAPMVGGITANAGTVRFAVAPTLSGSLTITSTDANFCVDGLAETSAWEPLATAADIVGPNNETKWKTAKGTRLFKIVSGETGKTLCGAKASGFTAVLR